MYTCKPFRRSGQLDGAWGRDCSRMICRICRTYKVSHRYACAYELSIVWSTWILYRKTYIRKVFLLCGYAYGLRVGRFEWRFWRIRNTCGAVRPCVSSCDDAVCRCARTPARKHRICTDAPSCGSDDAHSNFPSSKTIYCNIRTDTASHPCAFGNGASNAPAPRMFCYKRYNDTDLHRPYRGNANDSDKRSSRRNSFGISNTGTSCSPPRCCYRSHRSLPRPNVRSPLPLHQTPTNPDYKPNSWPDSPLTRRRRRFCHRSNPIELLLP